MKIPLRSFFCITLVLAMLLSSSGCSENKLAAAKDLMAEVDAVAWPQEAGELDFEFLTAVDDFGWELMSLQSQESGNLMLSPTSVFLALAMTLNGASGATLADMRQGLSAENIDIADFNEAARDFILHLNSAPAPTNLNVANSIWLRDDFPVADTFLATNATHYQAAAYHLDFSDPDAPDTINGWVAAATEGAIDKIVEEIDRQAMLFLINAIHFVGSWQEPFAANETSLGPFHAPAGDVEVPLMSRSGSIDRIEWEQGEGIVLPYSDGRHAFVALLPDPGQNPRQLLPDLALGQLARLIEQRRSDALDLVLPQFEMEYETRLKPSLTALGMQHPFAADKADFSRLQAEGTPKLYIDEVVHKTYIRVDEKGTEAAAATSVDMRVTSLPESQKEIRFDRPFLYAIFDLDAKIPLFIGILEDPSQP